MRFASNQRAVIGWLLVLVVALAVLWAYSRGADWSKSGDAARIEMRDPSTPEAVQLPLGTVASADAREAVAGDRMPASEGGSSVVFVQSRGLPVNRARVSVLGESSVHVVGSDSSGQAFETGIDGRCRVPVSRAVVIAVTRDGYLPGRATISAPDTECVVELRACIDTEITVANQYGTPVAGFAVAFAEGITGRDRLQELVQATEGSGFRLTSEGFVAVGVTDSKGVAHIGLPEGSHHPLLNVTDLPLIVDMDRSAGMVEAGQKRRYVVSEPLACVVRLQGDDIVLSRTVSVNMGFAGSHQAAKARYQALQSLRSMFPGSIVECGVDRSASARGSPSVKLYVCGRYSGMTQHEVECLPVSAWKAPRVLDVATGSQSRVKQLSVRMENPDGRRLEVMEGDLQLQVEYAGRIIGFDIPDRGSFEAPIGAAKIVASPRIPNGIVEDVALDVQPGEVENVIVRLRRPLYRGRLVFVDARGDVPIRGSVDYGTPNRMRTRMMAIDGSIEALFEVGATFVANFVTKPVRGQVPLNTEADPNIRQEWTIRIE